MKTIHHLHFFLFTSFFYILIGIDSIPFCVHSHTITTTNDFPFLISNREPAREMVMSSQNETEIRSIFFFLWILSRQKCNDNFRGKKNNWNTKKVIKVNKREKDEREKQHQQQIIWKLNAYEMASFLAASNNHNYNLDVHQAENPKKKCNIRLAYSFDNSNGNIDIGNIEWLVTGIRIYTYTSIVHTHSISNSRL